MFNLEQAIAMWRRQTETRGLRGVDILDELESHLRDQCDANVRSGLSEEAAFETSLQQMGQVEILQTEFAKVTSPLRLAEKFKHAFCILASIPERNLIMNTTNSTISLEPRWATYMKSGLFVAPALIVWAFCIVFVYPKLQEICHTAHVGLPRIYNLTNFIAAHFGLMSTGVLAVLALVEWRSRNWAQYRRATFGVAVFLINAAVLVLITLMVIMALIAIPALMHAK